MATDDRSKEPGPGGQMRDTLQLNAFVDGELAPAERAAVAARLADDRSFARAYAVLARLKAGVIESAEADARIALPARKPSWRRRALPATGALAAAIAVLLVVYDPTDPAPTAEPAPHTAVTLAGLPASPVVPHLDVAGLTLAGVALETPGGVPVLLATYRGPRGCRLELRAHAAEAVLPATIGTSRRTWIAGALAYELVAFGMPVDRFAAVADAAERATGGDRLPDPVHRRLREARLSSRPCVG